MIDRHQLRYFLAVVDAGNFSRAAARVNVTQPTLSVGVAKLEAALGSKLFLRNSQRVHLTPAGARLLQHARLIEGEFNTVERAVGGGSAPRRQVRLGILSTLPTAVTERIVALHRQAELPDGLEIVDGGERDLLGRLARGRLDVAITLLRASRRPYPSEPLFREGYALAVPESHPYATADEVRAEDLAEEVMIVRRHCEALTETSRHFTERGVRPEFSYRGQNDDKVLALVRAGLGVTVMPQSYAAPGVARPRLADFDLQREIGVVFAEHGESLREGESSVLAAIRTVGGELRGDG
jgi:DNA-binding transcriptional LysR family regulator